MNIKNGLKNFGKVIVLGSLALIYSCKCDQKAATAEAGKDVAAAGAAITAGYDSIRKAFVYDVGELKDLKLKDGTILKVGANSSESKLVAKLEDAAYNPNDKAPSAEDWITLDRVYFEFGKDSLTADSKAQVENIAKIMKAYPNAVLKIGGYTDNVGSADANKKVSGNRANVVLNELISLGIVKDKASAEGYGPEFPICPANDTDECKAKNRRVDIRVKSK